MYLLSLFFKRKKLVSPSFLLNPPPCHLFFDHNDYKHFVHILSSDEQSKCLIYLLIINHYVYDVRLSIFPFPIYQFGTGILLVDIKINSLLSLDLDNIKNKISGLNRGFTTAYMYDVQ